MVEGSYARVLCFFKEAKGSPDLGVVSWLNRVVLGASEVTFGDKREPKPKSEEKIFENLDLRELRSEGRTSSWCLDWASSL